MSRYTDACHNYKAKEKEKTSGDDRYSIEVPQPCGLTFKAENMDCWSMEVLDVLRLLLKTMWVYQ